MHITLSARRLCAIRQPPARARSLLWPLLGRICCPVAPACATLAPLLPQRTSDALIRGARFHAGHKRPMAEAEGKRSTIATINSSTTLHTPTNHTDITKCTDVEVLLPAPTLTDRPTYKYGHISTALSPHTMYRSPWANWHGHFTQHPSTSLLLNPR